ncbi:possible conserved transmembrane protein [Janibacter sp. HTCC2649]|uniref:hypothetical protein n=1 Tax=Janibacter sp. HTCC2649 TaxID=313589 RepID=UPI000066E9DB|nr:hypothetical protein [Janibacter sp. HTCC2649]EAP99006.1 possible conserved transmembrane protein [Janibacter sp. HTCC2649]
MKLYADLPGRRLVQILADLGLLAWIALWAWVGRRVHDVTMALAEPGRQLQGAGAGFREKLNAAGDGVDNLPLLDDRVASPFRSAAGAGTDIEKAGTDLISAVEKFALLIGWTTALVPILIIAIWWAFARGRFVRRASAAQKFIDADDDLDLFALRAMANQPMAALAKVSPDPSGAWRRGDRETIRALALLELKDSGLRPPRTA